MDYCKYWWCDYSCTGTLLKTRHTILLCIYSLKYNWWVIGNSHVQLDKNFKEVIQSSDINLCVQRPRNRVTVIVVVCLFSHLACGKIFQWLLRIPKNLQIAFRIILSGFKTIDRLGQWSNDNKVKFRRNYLKLHYLTKYTMRRLCHRTSHEKDGGMLLKYSCQGKKCYPNLHHLTLNRACVCQLPNEKLFH